MAKNSQKLQTGGKRRYPSPASRGSSQSSPLNRSFSSGGVVYQTKDDENLFLIIKPAKIERWQLPKGMIDKGESSRQAAIREVKEEGGVETEIIDKLGISQYFFVLDGQRIFKTVTYFLMKYLKGNVSDHDQEIDEAVFLPFDEAYERLTYKDDKETLKKAKKVLEQG